MKHTPATPQQVAQYQKAGRGFLITRNSATLADTDYEHVAREIVDALNKRHVYPRLVETLTNSVLNHCTNDKMFCSTCTPARALLRELGETE